MARITRRFAGQMGIPGDHWYPHLEDGHIVLGFGENDVAKANPVLVATEDEAVALILSRYPTIPAWVRMTADGVGSGNLVNANNLLIDGQPIGIDRVVVS